MYSEHFVESYKLNQIVRTLWRYVSYLQESGYLLWPCRTKDCSAKAEKQMFAVTDIEVSKLTGLLMTSIQ